MLRTIALTGLAALIAATLTSLAPPAQAQIGNIFPIRRCGRRAPFLAAISSSSNCPTTTRKCRNCRAAACCRPRTVRRRGRALRRREACASRSRWRRRRERPSLPRARQPGVAVAAAAAGPARRRQRAAGPPLPIPPASASPRACRNRRPTLQPGDEVVSEPPATKITNKKASFSGLDKITGRIINFDEDIGETVQFGALRVKTSACYTRPSTEAANTDAFVEVDEITLQGEVKRIFSGWMYAASPGLHGVEHPVYDIWLTDCKGPDQTIVSAQPDPPKAAAPPPAAKRPPQPKQAAPRPPGLPPQPQFQQQQPQQAPPPPPPQQRPGGLFGGLFGELSRHPGFAVPGCCAARSDAQQNQDPYCGRMIEDRSRLSGAALLRTMLRIAAGCDRVRDTQLSRASQ